MLQSLFIQNIVLIDKINIDFDGGFCVLTGETGSGKSIILGALGLAIGYRSNIKLLKKDQSQALVIANFDITNNSNCQEFLEENDLLDINDPNNLILKRTLKENGSSKAFINDIPIGNNLLSQIGKLLVEIHGQNDQSDLLNSNFHRQIIDDYAKNGQILSKIAIIYNKLKDIKQKINQIYQNQEKDREEKEYLEHIILELDQANIEIGEEDKLSDKKTNLQNKEKIAELINDLSLEITNANSNLFIAQQKLSRKMEMFNNFIEDKNLVQELDQNIEESIIKSDLAKENINEITKIINQDNESLEEIEERLFLIRGLARKLNKKSDELPQYLAEIKIKVENLGNLEINLGNLEIEEQKLSAEFLEIAQNLQEKRKLAAKKLSKKIEAELKDLQMNSVEFLVDFEELSQDKYNKFGIDKVKFLAKINKNADFGEINQIASGGELSRFMLAIKKSLMEVKSIPTIIFDEIDSGVGGLVAAKIGQKMADLGQKSQIIAITHHAQVAAKSDFHMKISKKDYKNETKTLIEILNNQESESEIARMLSGEEVTNEAIEAAKKLIG
ncbi:DNA repair protein RecN [Rickettsiales bacterium]|nr:DNA repair protein RecN [Rickettsiales bacterium]